MLVYRITIKAWTASFRYPTFIAGFQPTLPVPPLSTIFGLLSSVKGEILTPEMIKFGYVFMSKGKAVDLETIYELDEPLKAKANICKREILFEPELYLYLDDANLAESFKFPFYPLLLGRQTELAMVTEIKSINLTKKQRSRLGGTLLPFPMSGVYGPIQALPTHFTGSIPRQAIGVRPFYLVGGFQEYDKSEIWVDDEKNWGIWFWDKF